MLDMNTIRWLLLDLGGVLVEYVGTARIRSWMREPADTSDLYTRWLFSPSVRAFESGRMDADEFARGVVEELDLSVGPEEFLREFPDFVTGYYPGAEALLGRLFLRRPLALLSNTNRPQWEKLCSASRERLLFSRTFLSYQTGFVKPDMDAFRNVVRELQCAPGEILFFDDNADNVRGALNAGLRAERVDGIEGLRAAAERLGLL